MRVCVEKSLWKSLLVSSALSVEFEDRSLDECKDGVGVLEA